MDAVDDKGDLIEDHLRVELKSCPPDLMLMLTRVISLKVEELPC